MRWWISASCSRRDIQDRGRVLVRANPKAAARIFLQAASAGTRSAFHSLGYCLDVGVGVRRNSELALRWYRRAWRHGRETAAANIATVYRDRGLLPRAVAWWKKAMEAGVHEEAVEVGYCYQYGIGVRRNAGKAIACYRLAMRSRNIGEFWREAAMYHLAVLCLDSQPQKRTKAVALLERASIDQDYPEAMRLLAQLRQRRPAGSLPMSTWRREPARECPVRDPSASMTTANRSQVWDTPPGQPRSVRLKKASVRCQASLAAAGS